MNNNLFILVPSFREMYDEYLEELFEPAFSEKMRRILKKQMRGDFIITFNNFNKLISMRNLVRIDLRNQ